MLKDFLFEAGHVPDEIGVDVMAVSELIGHVDVHSLMKLEAYTCGEGNWVLIEDNDPKGGAVGPEDRQWFVWEGVVYEQGETGPVIGPLSEFLANLGIATTADGILLSDPQAWFL